MNVEAEAAYYRIDEAIQAAKEFQARTGRKPAMVIWDADGKPVPLATHRDVIDWQVRGERRA